MITTEICVAKIPLSHRKNHDWKRTLNNLHSTIIIRRNTTLNFVAATAPVQEKKAEKCIVKRKTTWKENWVFYIFSRFIIITSERFAFDSFPLNSFNLINVIFQGSELRFKLPEYCHPATKTDPRLKYMKMTTSYESLTISRLVALTE